MAVANWRHDQFSPTPELKRGASERAFQAMADVGNWNNQHPDLLIEPIPE